MIIMKKLMVLIFVTLISCDRNEKKIYSIEDVSNANIKEVDEDFRKSNVNYKVIENEDDSLPFIGKKNFETRMAISGIGTPHKYIEIKRNGDVYFSFEQENQSNRNIMEENFYAGKFSKYMKCEFKKLGNEIIYYEITTGNIYEVDSNNNRLTGEDCCTVSNYELGSKCRCIDALK